MRRIANMRNITYKYSVGDIVELKPKHYIEQHIGNEEVVYLKTVKIIVKKDYCGPCYKFEGVPGFYKEACIKRLIEAVKFDAYDDEDSEIENVTGPTESIGVNFGTGTNEPSMCQPPELDDDMEPSDDPEDKWYRISFSAKLSENDLRAMNKCFFDALNESMNIYDLADLVIEEDK
jgi:hypothetical protein